MNKYLILLSFILVSCVQKAGIPSDQQTQPEHESGPSAKDNLLNSAELQRESQQLQQNGNLVKIRILKDESSKYPYIRHEQEFSGEKTVREEFFVADHLIVVAKKDVSKEEFRNTVSGLGYEVGRNYSKQKYLIHFNDSQWDEAYQKLANLSLVDRVEPDAIGFPQAFVPNDPYYNNLWGMERIGMEEVWEEEQCSDSVVVMIIDSGIDYNHEDLRDNMFSNPGEIPNNNIDDDNNGYIDDVYGWDFVNDDNDPLDDANHGSHVSGTVTGKGNNGVGVAGVCWNAKLFAIKVIGSDNRYFFSDIEPGLEYAASFKKYSILLNASLGSETSTTSYEAAWKTVADAGILIGAAAMNDGVDIDLNDRFPSTYEFDELLVVSNINSAGNLYRDSNWGNKHSDMAGPGTSIMSTLKNGNYGYMTGTSMATPHVVGAAAMILSKYPDWDALKIKEILMNSGNDNSNLAGKTVSGKELHVVKALAYADSVYQTENPSSSSEESSSSMESSSSAESSSSDDIFSSDEFSSFEPSSSSESSSSEESSSSSEEESSSSEEESSSSIESSSSEDSSSSEEESSSSEEDSSSSEEPQTITSLKLEMLDQKTDVIIYDMSGRKWRRGEKFIPGVYWVEDGKQLYKLIIE